MPLNKILFKPKCFECPANISMVYRETLLDYDSNKNVILAVLHFMKNMEIQQIR